jgi:hypothetical protein
MKDVMEEMGIFSAFNVSIRVPVLVRDDIRKVLLRLTVSLKSGFSFVFSPVLSTVTCPHYYLSVVDAMHCRSCCEDSVCVSKMDSCDHTKVSYFLL